MILRKTILLSLIVAACTTASAQISNLTKAKTSLQKFEEINSTGTAELGKGMLNEAKEAIEKAVVHEKTKDNAEAWTIHALVNANVASLENSAEAATTAKEAIEKAKALDTDGKNAENLTIAGQLLGQFNFNQGVAAWEKQDFKSAYGAFEQALTFLPGATTLMYYCGLVARQRSRYKS